MASNGDLTYTIASTSSSYSTPATTVRAVELQNGWVGQVLVGDQIVWQTLPMLNTKGTEKNYSVRQDALNVAQAQVQLKLAQLFGE